MKAWIGILAIGLAAAGCRRIRDDHAEELNRARQQAALQGVAQRVVWRDRDGSTVTTVVQPPKPGDPTEEITTTRSAAAR